MIQNDFYHCHELIQFSFQKLGKLDTCTSCLFRFAYLIRIQRYVYSLMFVIKLRTPSLPFFFKRKKISKWWIQSAESIQYYKEFFWVYFRKFCKQHSKLFLKCHSKHFFKIYYNKLGPQQPIAAFFNTSQLSISMLDPMLCILISLDIIFFTLSSI